MDSTDQAHSPAPNSPPASTFTPTPTSTSSHLASLKHSLTLWALSIRALALSLWLHVVHLLLGSGLTLPLLPSATRAVRDLADRQRGLAKKWTGTEIPTTYPDPKQDTATPTPTPKSLRTALLSKDNQTYRDWRWANLDPYIGGAIAFVPAALILSGIWGMTTALFGPGLSDSWGNVWYLFIPVQNGLTATLAGILAAAQFPLALWAAPRVVRHHSRYLRAMLAPSESELLATRIEHLTITRSAAVDTQQAELRRIERDLHDGAQARLVAMGMTLDAAEHLLGSNPEAVRALLQEARQSSAKALQELRDLVRGIHPPVLADRGLPDAVRSLAMTCHLRTEVEADLPGRLEPAVESAAYFAVSEILTNAAKHAQADRAWIDIRYEVSEPPHPPQTSQHSQPSQAPPTPQTSLTPQQHGALRVTVTDDGRGGADISAGTGLRGIERRLATFDGILAVSSPLNGPTMVTMELPCVLSSQKTTSS
ncbi:sensor histidine kinase [Streptomyces sp. NPDC058471]|uniref:sensor histidine kinase n=1 Tax=Streptomyces sp. NPDC058471 TaxID=3346516 RepID=UPI003654A9AC